MPYSPQMNGKSERMNRTLLNMIRTKIIDSGIPKPLWGEALKCSVYELNRTPTTALDKGVTPSQMWHGRNDISKLRIFGCRAWYVNLPRGNKIDSKSTGSVMVGYCGGGYRLWHVGDEKIVKSRDVTFDESVMEFKEIERNLNQSIILPEAESNGNEKVVPKITGKENNKIKVNQNSDKVIEDEVAKSEGTKTRSGRVVNQPKNLSDYEVYNAYCFLSSSNEEPKTYQEAIKSSKWREAITKELDSHEKLGTWTPAELPEGQVAIDTMWVLKIKDDGTKKARLVGKGFQEPYEGGNQDFSYAPVCRLSTVRVLISVAMQRNWKLSQIDVPTAFLNGFLEKDIYI